MIIIIFGIAFEIFKIKKTTILLKLLKKLYTNKYNKNKFIIFYLYFKLNIFVPLSKVISLYLISGF